jgi:dUTP pyrophosphatase
MAELVFYILPSKDGEEGFVPTKKDGDAGYDLKAAYNALIKPNCHKLIKTNITLKMPKGYYGRIAPRSGLAYKCGIDVLAGIIDVSYRGNVAAILINHGKKDFVVERGDRIAQLIVTKILTGEKTRVVWGLPKEKTERGEKGFGSSGGSAMLNTTN